DDPAVFSVVPSQPIFHQEGLALIKGRFVGPIAALEIVRVDILGPAVADLLFHRSAHEVDPRLVKPVAELVSAAHPDQDRSRISHQAKSLFALPECDLCRLALANVASDGRGADDLALAVSNWRNRNSDRNAITAFANALGLKLHNRSPALELV